MNVTSVFQANYLEKCPIVVNQGGSSSAKTVSILQTLALRLIENKEKIATVAGQDIPNLKRGAMRDFEAYVLNDEYIEKQIKSYNKTERLYTFKNKSMLEFEAYDNEQDSKSGKRDYLFANEANGLSYEIFKQLQIRTKIQTFIDYNPSGYFWVHDKILTMPSDKFKLIISDHRHNPFLPDKIRNELEGLKEVDIEFWNVYARGKTGKIVGNIYTNWDLIDEMPNIGEKIYGLDFGFIHPNALIEVIIYENDVYINELIYESNQSSSDLLNALETSQADKLINMYADPARPDLIDEIKKTGYNISKANKNVYEGIVKLKSLRLHITKRSLSLIKEIKGYKWKVHSNGQTLQEPVKFKDDGMDALRYAIYTHLNKNEGSISW